MNTTPHAPRVALASMGCKVNAYDSAHIRGRLQHAVQFVPFDAEADVYIINTCTVTNRSDAEARNLVRRSKRRNPRAITIVTGCYAQTKPHELAIMPEVDYVFGNAEKSRVADVVLSGAFGQPTTPQVVVTDVQTLSEVRHITAAHFEGQTRAYLKVQEGCLHRCTYCIIPYSRGGTSRSVPLAQAIEQARQLVTTGYREMVLTGVHIGSWGHEYGLELADLVEALTRLDGVLRVRISSIDSPELRPRLVELITQHPKVAKHVHVPLQSGSDSVLRRMGRVYSAAEYREAIERLVSANADICVGTDVIVGFPGESDVEFGESKLLIEEAPIHYAHVFSFSPREGTPAATLPGALHGDTIKARSQILRELSARKKAAWASRFIGRALEVLFELAPDTVGARGRALNYLDVIVSGAKYPPGTVQPVRIESVTGGVARGTGVEA